TALVFVDQPKQDKPPEQQPVQLDVPLKGFQTVVAPDVIPTNIPPVNLQEHFDPKDYSGTGVEGGVATGIVPTGNEVFMEAIVEEKPAVLSGPVPVYPELLKQAQITGRVLVQTIVDTLGRAEANSVPKLVQSIRSERQTRTFAPEFSRFLQEEQLDGAIKLAEKQNRSHVARVVGEALSEVKPLLRDRATITAADINSVERAVER